MTITVHDSAIACQVAVLEAKLAVALATKRRHASALEREAEILLFLEVQRTVYQVADKFSLCVARARKVLTELHDAKLVHVSGYTQPKTGRPRMLFKRGEGKDAQAPKTMTAAERIERVTANRKRKREAVRNEAIVLASVRNIRAICTAAESMLGDVLRELSKSEGGLRVDQLVEALDSPPQLIRGYLQIANGMGRAHIADWVWNPHCERVPLWVPGEGKNAVLVPYKKGPKPKPKSVGFESRRVEVKVRRDPLTAAFFGDV